MKMNNRIKREADVTMSKVRAIARHIRNVEDNCLLLGEKLIEMGEIDLGHKLIANGYVHDASKFHGIEFEYLSIDPPNEESAKLKLKLAIYHHRTTNSHHVEYWARGIEEMPDVYLAELVCDIKARSEEFGTSLRDYIDTEGLKKWNISKETEVYKKIDRYINLLCATPFQEIK